MKKIFVLFISLLLVGCSADYTLTIDEDKFTEKIKFYSLDNDSNINRDWHISSFYADDSDSDLENDNDSCSSNCYKYTKDNDTITFSYDFNSNNISKSAAINNCFNSFRIINRDNDVMISTSNGVKCFNNNFDSLTINIVFNDSRNIKYSNADRVVGNKYIWNINNDNYNTKSINMTIEGNIDNGEGVSNLHSSILGLLSSSSSSVQVVSVKRNFFTDIYFDKDIVIFSIVFLVFGGIGILIFKKINKDGD